ncbi:hypothetical protein Peur_026361 [Populus x canadensis]
MQRKKGQFTSSKADSYEGAQLLSGCGATQGSGQDDSMLETLRVIGSKSTPMMHRGPAGPRTLCNACGLKLYHNTIYNEFIGIYARVVATDIVSPSNGDYSAEM